jgi:membrane associated rhomboid family serine protease
MNRSPAAVTGLVICALLGVLDLIGLVGLGMDPGPPVGIVLGGAALGVITLAAAIPTWRGSRSGLLTVIASRAISALLGVPVFFADQAPEWARIATAIAIIATVIGIGLLAAARRQPAMGVTQ